MTNELVDPFGEAFVFAQENLFDNTKVSTKISEQNPGIKSKKVSRIKIQMGLSCNYSCEYCSQRFVPNAPETNPQYVDKFVAAMKTHIEGEPKRIEFWGGEPFVYWKTMKPLAYALREAYPNTMFSTITNGSLITDEIIDFLVELNFSIGLSHDGPGQHIRGPDPFDDPEKARMILKLWNTLGYDRMSFNPMLHKESMDRVAVIEWFKAKLGTDHFRLGEGEIIDTYDEGGVASSFPTIADHYAFRERTMHQIRNNELTHFVTLNDRMDDFMRGIWRGRNADTLYQKCSMDREDQLAVDLRGNVLTCQNVSAVSTAGNGRPHLMGHLSRIEDVKVRTATHWKFRDKCTNCPVLQSCRGSCMFLQKELFEASCNNAYTDHIPFFAASIEALTGWLPYKIEAQGYELPEERKWLWGLPPPSPVQEEK